jgi:hypothetical protein
MTTQDLGSAQPFGASSVDDSPGALGTLFDTSPAYDVQTSTAACTGFVLGLFAVLAVPFSLTMTLSVALAGVALVSSVVGLARTSKARFTGGVLASLGLVLALLTLALVGLRYLGLDTTFGDDFVPTLRDWSSALNGLLPTP